MTAPTADPINSQKDDDDNRWYTHPVTQERFLSVTTGLKSVAKDALVPWASLLAARTAIAELPKLVRAFFTRDCGRTYNRCDHPWDQPCPECPCRACKPCTVKWLADRHLAESARRAQEGTEVHQLVKFWVIWGTMPAVPEHLQPYIDSFFQFVADFGLTNGDWLMSEGTILNRKHMYAGTLDQILRIDPTRTEIAAEWCDRAGRTGLVTDTLIDTKSREGEKKRTYPDQALQLTGYSRGEVVLMPDGTEWPLPNWDATAILQLRPDGYNLQHTWHTDEEFEAFLAAVKLFRWLLERGKAAVSSKSFPMSEQFKRDRTNRRARERRAVAKGQCPECRVAGGEHKMDCGRRTVGAGSQARNLPQPRPTTPPPAPPTDRLSINRRADGAAEFRVPTDFDTTQSDVEIRQLGTATQSRTGVRKNTPRTTRSARDAVVPQLEPTTPSLYDDDIPF